ncbi:unnamed protein product, partial [Laminaria digitata]
MVGGGIEDPPPDLLRDSKPHASKAPAEGIVRVISDQRFFWHAFVAGLGSLVVTALSVLMQCSGLAADSPLLRRVLAALPQIPPLRNATYGVPAFQPWIQIVGAFLGRVSRTFP